MAQIENHNKYTHIFSLSTDSIGEMTQNSTKTKWKNKKKLLKFANIDKNTFFNKNIINNILGWFDRVEIKLEILKRDSRWNFNVCSLENWYPIDETYFCWFRDVSLRMIIIKNKKKLNHITTTRSKSLIFSPQRNACS